MAALRQKRSQPWQGPRRVTGVFVREALSRHFDALRPMYAPVQVSGWIGTCRMVGRGRLPGSAPPSLKSAASSAQAPASICERSHTDINRYRAGPEQWGGVHEVRQSERAVAALTRPRDAVPVLVASAFGEPLRQQHVDNRLPDWGVRLACHRHCRYPRWTVHESRLWSVMTP